MLPTELRRLASLAPLLCVLLLSNVYVALNIHHIKTEASWLPLSHYRKTFINHLLGLLDKEAFIRLAFI